ncbi:hypothetical protein [Niabella ginsengisoli]|uniref:Uncharacterized protein n=1 Tax=Niabella ginsengisoli TaxID=522298 RepID=A0ABS9SJ21_9BACT|nr:hypothetical protein [Niabella ginsengisoli]MCH5598350.1 hypothetical protein [Niabella ginsengisoli]
MAGEDDVNLQEFVDFFPEVQLPFMYADSSLYAKTDDSLLISPEIFNEFTPDSILKTSFNNEIPKLYAIGKFKEKDGATYLLSKAASAKHKIMFITAYNDKTEFLAGFPAMKSKKDKGTTTSITIDKLYNINKKTVKKLSNDIEISGDDVYVLNNAVKKFMLIMTDSLGDDAELINPIDTLSKEYRYAGDYGSGNRNIISIRDNVKSGRISFFIHLEEKNSQCSGELRGEANIVSDNIVEYRQPGDPCVLQFKFDKSGVTLNEVEGCGSRMGALDCTFNGRYPKRKVTKKYL